MRYEIKELGIGGILDQTITLIKNHFGLLLGVMLVLYIPFSLVQHFFIFAVTPDLPLDPTEADYDAYLEKNAANTLISAPLNLIMVLIVTPITNAAVIHSIANAYLEISTSVGEAMKRSFRLILPLLLTWFVMWLAIMGGFILLVIPGILCAFWFSLSSHVVVLEGVSGLAALKRSKQLMKGNMGTVFVLGLLIVLIQWGVMVSASFIPQQHLRIVGLVLSGAIVVIFGAAAFVVFYFSCRCKHENFDLTRLAEAVSVEAPGEVGPDVAFNEQ